MFCPKREFPNSFFYFPFPHPAPAGYSSSDHSSSVEEVMEGEPQHVNHVRTQHFLTGRPFAGSHPWEFTDVTKGCVTFISPVLQMQHQGVRGTLCGINGSHVIFLSGSYMTSALNFDLFTPASFFLPNDRHPVPPMKKSKETRPNNYMRSCSERFFIISTQPHTTRKLILNPDRLPHRHTAVMKGLKHYCLPLRIRGI